MKLIHRAVLPLLLLLPVEACIPIPPPAPAVDPRGAPITTQQIVLARHDTKQTLYSILGGLAGAAAGVLVGGKIGYEIGYAHDIRVGCEDCGLNGMLAGAGIGLAAGLFAGGNLGMHAGARADRADAVGRIIVERARGAMRYRMNSFMLGAEAPWFGQLMMPSDSSERRRVALSW